MFVQRQWDEVKMTSSTVRTEIRSRYVLYVLHFPYPCLSLLYFVIWKHTDDDDNDGNEDQGDGGGYEDGDCGDDDN